MNFQTLIENSEMEATPTHNRLIAPMNILS